MTMRIEAIKDTIPDYAKDIRLNLGSIVGDTSVTDQQKWGALVSAAHAAGNHALMSAVFEDAKEHLSAEAFAAAQSAAAIMAMNNVYYRAVHLLSSKDYQTLPAKLRMNIIANPGVDKLDFELWSIAVSAINGCGMCLDSHEAVVRKAGATTTQVQTMLRIAAIIAAAAAVLNAEERGAAA
ncbi:MAG: carboxymuconolactone decarboxylase family protein [Parvularculaceae bacterium]